MLSPSAPPMHLSVNVLRQHGLQETYNFDGM